MGQVRGWSLAWILLSFCRGKGVACRLPGGVWAAEFCWLSCTEGGGGTLQSCNGLQLKCINDLFCIFTHLDKIISQLWVVQCLGRPRWWGTVSLVQSPCSEEQETWITDFGRCFFSCISKSQLLNFICPASPSLLYPFHKESSFPALISLPRNPCAPATWAMEVDTAGRQRKADEVLSCCRANLKKKTERKLLIPQ